MGEKRARQLAKGDVAGRYGTGSLTSGADAALAGSGPNALVAAPMQDLPQQKKVYVVGLGLVEERVAMRDISYRQHAISSRHLTNAAPKVDAADFCGECKRNKKAGDCICGKTEAEVAHQKKMKRMQSAPNLKSKKGGAYDSSAAEQGAAGRAMGVEKVNRVHSKGPSPMKKGGSARWGHATAGAPLMSAAVTPRGASSKVGGKGLD